MTLFQSHLLNGMEIVKAEEYENIVGYHEDDNINGQSSNGSSTIQGGEAGTVAGMAQRAFEAALIKIHANLFVHGGPTREDLGFVKNIQKTLGDRIGRVTTWFREQGASIALSNIAIFFEYGAFTACEKSRSIFRFCFLEVHIEQLKDRDQEITRGETDKALTMDEDQQKSRLDLLEQQIAYNLVEEEKSSSTKLL